MTFENVYIPTEERVTYTIPNRKEYRPAYCTIDKERDAILFGYAGGTEDLPDLTRFALIVKEDMYLFDMYKHVSNNDIRWTIYSEPEIKEGKEYIYELLREAITVYGFCGRGWKYGDVRAGF